MSWHYSQALAAEYSEAACLDGVPFAPSKLKNIRGQFCYKGKMTESLIRSLSGTMSKPSTVSHGEDTSTSLPADSPAKISASPEKAPESTGNDPGYGLKCIGLLARYDRDSSSWKTLQLSLDGDSEEFSETWPRWGIMRDGECWELVTPERHTNVIGSGFWPTPESRNQEGYQISGGKKWPRLGAAVKQWPTPTSRDFKDGQAPVIRDGKIQTDQLGRAVFHGGTKTRQTYPTPKTNGFCSGSGAAGMVNNLAENGKIDEETRRSMRAGNGGQLNPDWVEWLMGWPIGWTDLRPLETDRFRQWLRLHGKY